MTVIVYSIDLMSLIYCIIAIPLIILLSKSAWGVGKYIQYSLGLKYKQKQKELQKK